MSTGYPSATMGLVCASFVGNGPYPLQLVCTTEDDTDTECDTLIAEVEPGTGWDELEALVAAHARSHAAERKRLALAEQTGEEET